MVFKEFGNESLVSEYVDEIGMIYPVSYFNENGNPVAEYYFRITSPKSKTVTNSHKLFFSPQEDCVKIFGSFKKAKIFSDRLLLLK